MHRIISEVRPRYAIIENVPMLTIRGGTRVIADLAEIGYDCEWQVIGADEVGAWHRRKRIWIVAYTKHSTNRTNKRKKRKENKISKKYRKKGLTRFIGGASSNKEIYSNNVAYPRCEHGEGQEVLREHEKQNRQGNAIKSERSTQCDRERVAKRTKDVSNTDHNGNRTQKHRTDKRGKKKAQRSQFKIQRSQPKSSRYSKDVPNTNNSRHMDRQIKEQPTEGRLNALCESESGSTYERDFSDTDSKRGCSWNTKRKDAEDVRKLRRSPITGYWNSEPNVGRVANGIPNRVDRLRGLGNAIVPQVAYEIMKRIK